MQMGYTQKLGKEAFNAMLAPLDPDGDLPSSPEGKAYPVHPIAAMIPVQDSATPNAEDAP